MSSTMPSAKYSCSGSPLKFWNGKTAIDGLSGSAERCGELPTFRRSAQLVDPDRRAMFLSSWGPDPQTPNRVCHDLSVGDIGNVNTARLGHPLHPCGNIDAVPENVACLNDDIAEIEYRSASRCACPAAQSALRLLMPSWISTAQRTASTALANSTRKPSPICLTMRPRCSAILGRVTHDNAH